jgi:gluconokinase
MDGPSIVVVMGVAGAGKSTVGRLAADQLGWVFVEGDDLHPPENIARMAAGLPLTDAHRDPWYARIGARLDDLAGQRRSVVLAASALRVAHRRMLAAGRPGLRFVVLDGPPDLIRNRLQQRRGHFMGAGLLESQLAAFERPQDVWMLAVDAPADELAARIAAWIRAGTPRVG